MVIERMDGFAALGRQLLDKFQGSSPSEPRVDAPVENGHSKGGDGQRPTVDKAEISPQAHRLIALRQVMDSGLQALAKEPDVRPDRVAEARSRLNQGFYNSMDVRSRVAERLDEVARHLEDI